MPPKKIMKIERKEKIKNIIKKVGKILVYIFSAIGMLFTLLFSCSAIMPKNNDQQKENSNKPIQALVNNNISTNDYWLLEGEYLFNGLSVAYYRSKITNGLEIRQYLTGDIDYVPFFSDTQNLIIDIIFYDLSNIYNDFRNIVDITNIRTEIVFWDTEGNNYNYYLESDTQYYFDIIVKSGFKTYNYYDSLIIENIYSKNTIGVYSTLNVGLYKYVQNNINGSVPIGFTLNNLRYIAISQTSNKLQFHYFDMGELSTKDFFGDNINNTFVFKLLNDNDIKYFSSISFGSLGLWIVVNYMYYEGANNYNGYFSFDYSKAKLNSYDNGTIETDPSKGLNIYDSLLNNYDSNNYIINTRGYSDLRTPFNKIEIITYKYDFHTNYDGIIQNTTTHNHYYVNVVVLRLYNYYGSIVDYYNYVNVVKYGVHNNNEVLMDNVTYSSRTDLYNLVQNNNVGIYNYKIQLVNADISSNSYNNFFTYFYPFNVVGNIAIDTTLNDFFGIFGIAIENITPLFNVLILPNITLGFLIFFPFVVSILIFVIWLFKR